MTSNPVLNPTRMIHCTVADLRRLVLRTSVIYARVCNDRTVQEAEIARLGAFKSWLKGTDR